MKLVGRKRKALTAAATVAAAAGLVVGLAGTAAAVPPPPAPPGHYWDLFGSSCETYRPFSTQTKHYTDIGSCVAGTRWVSGGPGQPGRSVDVIGTRYHVYYLRPLPDQAPVGYLDACDSTNVWGWTRDPDWAGSLEVHLYNQNGLVRGITAAEVSEPGTGGTNQRFVAAHGQPSGAVLTVHAIGRDAAGGANGVNPPLRYAAGAGHSCVVP